MSEPRWDTTAKDRPRSESASAIASLRVLSVAGQARRERPHVLRAPATPIGRAVGEGGVSLAADPRVSRLHAVIELGEGGAARIVDRSSTGTEVDGERVATRDLHDGALVFVGDSALLFRRGPPEPDDDDPGGALLGDAPAMRALRRVIGRVAPTAASVLIQGETGTGKELVASALHAGSGRSGPLVAVNCSAIPAALAEAQLFGHLAGSYTGAKASGPGFFRAAAAGTIFLDELGDLPPEVQPKLLRVLEDRTVTPVGATKAVPVDVRVIAATNRDLLLDVDAGRFRGDLYARVCDFSIELPPLRARREDVLPILVRDLGEGARFEPALVRALLLHQWPFNVRELRSVARQLRIVGEGAPRYELSMVGDRLDRGARIAARAPTAEPSPQARGADAVPDRAELEELLRAHHGVIADVARATGRSRRQVYRWIEQHGIELADWKRE